MLLINLDATAWRVPLDVYESLLPALGAPIGHGHGVAAVVDSTIWTKMNAVDPPFQVDVHNLTTAPVSVVSEVELLRDCISKARAERVSQTGEDVSVAINIIVPTTAT